MFQPEETTTPPEPCVRCHDGEGEASAWGQTLCLACYADWMTDEGVTAANQFAASWPLPPEKEAHDRLRNATADFVKRYRKAAA